MDFFSDALVAQPPVTGGIPASAARGKVAVAGMLLADMIDGTMMGIASLCPSYAAP